MKTLEQLIRKEANKHDVETTAEARSLFRGIYERFYNSYLYCNKCQGGGDLNEAIAKHITNCKNKYGYY